MILSWALPCRGHASVRWSLPQASRTSSRRGWLHCRRQVDSVRTVPLFVGPRIRAGGGSEGALTRSRSEACALGKFANGVFTSPKSVEELQPDRHRERLESFSYEFKQLGRRWARSPPHDVGSASPTLAIDWRLQRQVRNKVARHSYFVTHGITSETRSFPP